MAEATEYDVVVVGAGPTGENVAGRVAAAGLSAVIVESELVGGECSYWACMPSKALLRSGAALADALEVAGSGVPAGTRPDAAAVLRRRDSFTSNWRDDGQVKWLAGAGIDLVRGHARLVGERTVEIDTDRRLTARRAVVLCPGTGAVVPPVDGLADIGVWTSREATSAKRVPDRLIVVGGGVVACEMATAWHSLGSTVTVLVRGDSLLTGWEPFASSAMLDGMRAAGIEVRTGTQLARASRERTDGPVTAVLDDGSTLTADELLVATGRRPRTEDIGLAAVGLTDGDWIDVDDTCRVTAVEGGWLYAAGDVNHRALLTHMGKYQARACAAAIVARAEGRDLPDGPWQPWVATADHAAVPQVVFGRPELAAVGRTEQQARDAGLNVRAVEYSIGNVAGAALVADGYTGNAKMVVDADRRVIVGCTLSGAGVGELIHAATVAVVGEVPLDRLWHAVPSYPTVSEIWLRLLEEYGL